MKLGGNLFAVTAYNEVAKRHVFTSLQWFLDGLQQLPGTPVQNTSVFFVLTFLQYTQTFILPYITFKVVAGAKADQIKPPGQWDFAFWFII